MCAWCSSIGQDSTPHDEQTAEVMRFIRSFMRQASPVQA